MRYSSEIVQPDHAAGHLTRHRRACIDPAANRTAPPNGCVPTNAKRPGGKPGRFVVLKYLAVYGFTSELA